jgi:hypothetical protein
MSRIKLKDVMWSQEWTDHLLDLLEVQKCPLESLHAWQEVYICMYVCVCVYIYIHTRLASPYYVFISKNMRTVGFKVLGVYYFIFCVCVCVCVCVC